MKGQKKNVQGKKNNADYSHIILNIFMKFLSILVFFK